MLLRRLLAPLIALVSLAACDSTTFSLEGPLAIETGASEVRLHNRTSAPVYAAVVEREHLALYDGGPCTNPAQCDGIDPGERRNIPYAEIVGYKPGAKEAVVLWWHLVPAPGGGYSPHTIHSEVIQL